MSKILRGNMKKLILIFCLLLLPSLVLVDMNPYIMGINNSVGGSSCSGNFGNTSETETGNTYMAAGDILIQRINLSSCGSGNPTSINIYTKAWSTSYRSLRLYILIMPGNQILYCGQEHQLIAGRQRLIHGSQKTRMKTY